ncbi:MAG: TlpA disulfide reductase family protein [Bacteroidota bacterium]
MKRVCLICFSIFNILSGYAQTEIPRTREVLQKEVIYQKVLRPQLNIKPLVISNQEDIDNFFQLIEKTWASAAKDSLKTHPSPLTLDEFSRLDAYCYVWALAVVVQDMNAGATFTSQIIRQYMIPALKRDYIIVKRMQNSFAMNMIHVGNLGNTLSLGSMNNADKETVMATYQLYNDFSTLFASFSINPNLRINKVASIQLKNMEDSYYSIMSSHAFYMGEFDKSMGYILTGLPTEKYSKSRAVYLSQKLIHEFLKRNEPEKCITLLDALALNTTNDNLNRDTLQNLYLLVDKKNGNVLYNNISKKLSKTTFINSSSQIKLPTNWNFIANAIPTEKLKKAKYILIDFWYSSCVPCLSEIPQLNVLFDKLAARDDVVYLSVNTDYMNGKDVEFVKKRSSQLAIRYPVVYDNNNQILSKQLNVISYPSKYVLNIEGDVFIKTDRSPISLESLEAFIKELDR